MLEGLFWTSAAMLLYAYLGFPLLVYLRARLFSREISKRDVMPSVTLVIVAHDEAPTIGHKLENVLALDYPKDRLAVIVASDGSMDGTEAIVEGFRQRGVLLLAFPRRGKIPALNDAAACAGGEILAFSDANSMFDPSALRRLVRAFADPSVGGVAGNQVYGEGPTTNAAASGERSYWSFDRWLKRHQSAAGSVTSATGAIYAIRRELFEPVPSGVCDDAVVSYRIVARGWRLVFEPDAVACENVSPSAAAEFGRKLRVCVRGLRGLAVKPGLFNPFRFGFYSVQLVSHKLFRWLAPLALIALFVTALALLESGAAIHRAAAAAQLLFYLAALTGASIPRAKTAASRLARLFTFPYYFCLSNAACLLALWWVARGRRIERWEVRRREVIS